MALTITIASEEVAINPNAWSVIDKLNIRSTISFVVINLLNLSSIQKGDPIVFERDGNTIFNGWVDTVLTQEVEPDVLFTTVTGVDNCSIADRRLVAASIENQTAGYIVINFILPILAEENVTAGIIDDGIVLTKVNFNYYTCTQALDLLSETTGFYWNINYDKELDFSDRASNTGTDLDSNIHHKNFSLSQENSQ